MIRSKDLFLELQQEFVNQCYQVENGEISVLDALIGMRKTRNECEKIIQNIKDFETEKSNEIEMEAAQWNGKYKNAKIEIRNGGLSYDFSKIQEHQWAKENLAEIEEKYKIAYQNKLKGFAMIDEATGEEMQVPEVKPRKSSIIVKFDN